MCEYSPTLQGQSVPEMLKNLHVLMLLSVQEDFIEFCHCENFKSNVNSIQFGTFKLQHHQV